MDSTIIQTGTRYLKYFYYVLTNHPRLKPAIFTVGKQDFQYFIHPYNHTWDNERAVEIPLVQNYLNKAQSKAVLEVGNVLHNYIALPHQVVDKYETGPNVITTDILDYKPKQKYDYIVSISTLEHIGWEEAAHQGIKADPKKLQKAVKHLRTLLKPKGLLVVTVPIGFNPHLDELLSKKKIATNQDVFLKRISQDNVWQEVSEAEALSCKYNQPYLSANAIHFFTIKA